MAELTGIFLTAGDVNATADFYRRVAGLDLEELGDDGYHYWRAASNGVQLAIHAAAQFAAYSHPPRRESNVTHLYFHIPDRDAFLEMVRGMSIQPTAIDDVVVTIPDPDGRQVMFGTA